MILPCEKKQSSKRSSPGTRSSIAKTLFSCAAGTFYKSSFQSERLDRSPFESFDARTDPLRQMMDCFEATRIVFSRTKEIDWDSEKWRENVRCVRSHMFYYRPKNKNDLYQFSTTQISIITRLPVNIIIDSNIKNSGGHRPYCVLPTTVRIIYVGTIRYSQIRQVCIDGSVK